VGHKRRYGKLRSPLRQPPVTSHNATYGELRLLVRLARLSDIWIPSVLPVIRSECLHAVLSFRLMEYLLVLCLGVMMVAGPAIGAKPVAAPFSATSTFHETPLQDNGLGGQPAPEKKVNRAKAEALIRDAEKKLAADDLKGNVEFLNEAARIDPTNPRVWWKLCEGYQLTEEFDLAIAACQRNVDLRGNAIDYNSLGLAYMAKRDYPNAALAFEKSVKQSPDQISYSNFVWSLESAHQYDKAAQAAQRWVELSAGDPSELTSALENLGAILVELGRADEAKEAFAKVHETDSKRNIKTCRLKRDQKGDVSVVCSDSP